MSSKEFQNFLREKEEVKGRRKKKIRRCCKKQKSKKRSINKKQNEKNKKWQKWRKQKLLQLKPLPHQDQKINICCPRRIAETSDCDSESSEDMSVYSSSEASCEVLKSEVEEYESSSANCTKCWTFFQGEEKKQAVGCDMPYCRCWYHLECRDIDFSERKNS